VKRSELFKAKLRADPLTADEIDYFNHLKTLNLKRLVKLLPAWARTKKIERAAEFIAGQKPHYPGWTGARAMAAAKFTFPSATITDAAEYIAEFKRLNGPYKNPRTIRLLQNPHYDPHLLAGVIARKKESYKGRVYWGVLFSGKHSIITPALATLKQAKKRAALVARMTGYSITLKAGTVTEHRQDQLKVIHEIDLAHT
jgi:hypothetical protein